MGSRGDQGPVAGTVWTMNREIVEEGTDHWLEVYGHIAV